MTDERVANLQAQLRASIAQHGPRGTGTPVRLAASLYAAVSELTDSVHAPISHGSEVADGRPDGDDLGDGLAGVLLGVLRLAAALDIDVTAAAAASLERGDQHLPPGDDAEAGETAEAGDDAEASEAAEAEAEAERRNHQRRLHDLRRRFELAMTHAPIGMAISVIDGTWLAVNPALCDLFGYPEQELLAGISFADLTHPDDLAAELLLIDEAFAGERDHYSLDKRYLHADGHTVWTTTSVSLVRDDTGIPRYFVAQCLDVTERIRMETELRATTEQLRESDDLRVAFLRATSHELRTPLTVVAGMADTLLYRQDDLDRDRTRTLLERMVVHTERLSRLIEDLLDVDRLSTGLIEARRDRLALDVLVRDVLPTIDTSRHRLALDLEPVSIDGDQAKLERVVANLVINAVRHTPIGSTIRVTTVQRDAAAVITVEDGGAGIPFGYEERIFDPFVQGPASREDPQPGTGLGLTLVRELTALHGGTVSAHNAPGGGARFEVVLPKDTVAIG